MQNAAPEQVQEMGAAMSRAGLTAYSKGQQIQMRIQEQVDDANVKAAETKFIKTATDTLHGENGYLNKQGVDALNGYDGAAESLAKSKQEILDSLGNDVQKHIFQQVAQRHLVTFGAQMAEHRATQRTQYTANEAINRADSMRSMAQNVDVGSKAQSVYIEAGVAELGNALSTKGIKADSEQYAKAVRDYRTQVTQDNVNRLIVAGSYADAKTLLGEQMQAGNVDPDAADRMRATIQSNVERVEVSNKADEIFSPYKGKQLQATDLESMLKEVESIKNPEQRRQVESLVKGQFSEQHAIQQQKYRDNLDYVVNYKYSHNGSLKGIDPVRWGALDSKDRYELTRPPATETNLDTWFNFVTKPETLTTNNVKAAFMRGLLSKGDFRALTERAATMENKPDYVQDANAINLRIDYFASQFGMNVYGAFKTPDGKTTTANLTPDDKMKLGSLKFKVMQDIDRIKAQNHGKVTADEVDAAIKRELIQRTLQIPRSAWSPLAIFGNRYSESKKYNFEVPAGATHVAPGSDGKMHYTDGQNDLGVEE
jgi:hypothetical protein